MEIEDTATNMPGCSKDEEYMQRKIDWPLGVGTSSQYFSDAPETGEVILSKDSYISKIETKTKPNTMYNSSDTYSSSNIYNSTKPKSKIGDEQNVRKGIKLIENRKIVPPHVSSAVGKEWTRVGRRGRLLTESSQISGRQDIEPVAASSGQVIRNMNSYGKVNKRIVKPCSGHHYE